MIADLNWKWTLNAPSFRPALYPDEGLLLAVSPPGVSFYDIWGGATDPEWLPYLAVVGGATKEQLVMASCAVARLCFETNDFLSLTMEERNGMTVALETAEAWCHGGATDEQVSNSHFNIDTGTLVGNAAYYATMTYPNTLNFATSFSLVAYHALEVGVESQLICSTIRKHLVFEQPTRSTVLTFWQRLAVEDDDLV